MLASSTEPSQLPFTVNWFAGSWTGNRASELMPVLPGGRACQLNCWRKSARSAVECDDQFRNEVALPAQSHDARAT
jgi:hypothetical protein